jgi:hypothetical protein
MNRAVARQRQRRRHTSSWVAFARRGGSGSPAGIARRLREARGKLEVFLVRCRRLWLGASAAAGAACGPRGFDVISTRQTYVPLRNHNQPDGVSSPARLVRHVQLWRLRR